MDTNKRKVTTMAETTVNSKDIAPKMVKLFNFIATEFPEAGSDITMGMALLSLGQLLLDEHGADTIDCLAASKAMGEVFMNAVNKQFN